MGKTYLILGLLLTLSVGAPALADGTVTFYSGPEIKLPDGPDFVTVWMKYVGSAQAKPVRVVMIYGDAGTDSTGFHWTRTARADKIVSRLQEYVQGHPQLEENLVAGTANNCPVLTPNPADPAAYIITADPESVKHYNDGNTYNVNQWAQTVATEIRDALQSKGTRDALFDYQLKKAYEAKNPDPDIVQQYHERLANYTSMGDEAFASNDLSTAKTLYTNVIALNDQDNYAHIQLAAVYATQKLTKQAQDELALVSAPSDQEATMMANVKKQLSS